MGKTMIQKIFEKHSSQKAVIDEIIDVDIDVRIARDFGGANVVKNLEEFDLPIENPSKTYFTFDCNPGGCDQKYAANQHICRIFARQHGIKVFDINSGIGTHLVIDEGIAKPGSTVVSTDSHANILGAYGAFGQGMGDKDIAHAWAYGKVWFKVPPSLKILLEGRPSKHASPKDIALRLLQQFGANGLLGYSAEIYGEYVDNLSLDGRITISSMATEMGGIIVLFTPQKNDLVADSDASYADVIKVDINGLEPMISRPGHPEDVVSVKDVEGTTVDSGFIGSCTNGRIEDMKSASNVLKNKKVAPGRILKIVPSTDSIWKQCLDNGIIQIFKNSGALVGSAGCAGCAAGQIGQTGKGEVTVSSGNRNFVGKQGSGDIYLASPETVATSLVAGYITTAKSLPVKPKPVEIQTKTSFIEKKKSIVIKPKLEVKGRAWVIKKDNIDTDMIFHNRYLSITDIKEMGQYTFDNLKGFENFAKEAKPGDIIVTGKNFGCGSSRQQAVDCFKSLGISVIIAESFGAIYERNAINNAMPILIAPNITSQIDEMDTLNVDFSTGEIFDQTQVKNYFAKPFSKSQLEIYKRGGLLNNIR
ncbi:MAG: homoaconitate hydratase [Candidatus Thermoplasmatota archaeon]|nr:homoaconitate hydratase [Candidatus Thermoplasmatota archaeon]